MTSLGPALVFVAVALQSGGKVLYGTFLTGVPMPLFVAIGVVMTGAVFLALVRLRLPTEGRLTLLLLNLWTAIGFISFFYALKHLPPAVFASVEIGMSLVTAIAITSIHDRAWPATIRVLACVGIIAGGAVLAYAETAALISHPSQTLVWTAIGASIAAGVSSALSLIASRKLALQGWSSRATLAHRFYLTAGVALVWLPLKVGAAPMPDATMLASILGIASLAILIPLLLFQLALRKTDEVSVMVCVAAQPALSFLLSIPSPAYSWDSLTLIGVGAVTACVGMDILAKHWRRGGLAIIVPERPRLLLIANHAT